jgi:intein/homing endonuclease
MIDNYRVKEVLHKHMRSGYYAINNELKISNDHPVLANGTWTRPEDLSVGDTINGIPVVSLEYVEQLTPTVSIVIDGESFDVHTENNIYTVHGRYREVRQEAA